MRKSAFAVLWVMAMVALAGCVPTPPPTPPGPATPGTITGVVRVIDEVPPSVGGDRRAERLERNRLIPGRPQQFRVTGTGTCGALRVHFGDGTSTEYTNVDLSGWLTAAHTYGDFPDAWRGLKRVRVEPVRDCEGGAAVDVSVLEPEHRIALAQPTANACNAIGPVVRAGTVVTGRSLNAEVREITFSRTCPFCIRRGIDGSPEAALGPPFTFPFPGLRAHSLVYRVGTQVAQGGNGISFTANQNGPLELCVNDDVLSDNSGAWGIGLTVDERGAQ